MGQVATPWPDTWRAGGPVPFQAALSLDTGEGFDAGDQIFHEYADHTANGSLLEYANNIIRR
eukprot:9488131-Pyramimonas_sp.AAC.2